MRFVFFSVLLLTAQLCLAQFDISKLPKVEHNELLVYEHSSRPEVKAEILIDNQYLALDGKEIKNLQVVRKRLLRIKVFQSSAFKNFDLKSVDFEEFDRVKIIIHKLEVKNKFIGEVKVAKHKINLKPNSAIDLESIGIVDGNVVDIYFEEKQTKAQFNEAIFWKLSEHYTTQKAFHFIEYPEICKIELKKMDSTLNYVESNGSAKAFISPFGESIKYSKNTISTRVTDIKPSVKPLSVFTYNSIDYDALINHTAVKFGSVSDEELDMVTYKEDTSASAVILYDHGIYVDREFKFTRHIRIKILSKSGLSWGNWTFNTPDKSDFKVQVTNKEDGKVVKETIDPSSIYKERIIDGFFLYKVFANNVRVGSVIDIEYSHIGLPFEWRFQQLIPVKYSELEIESTKQVHYNISHFGFEPIETISKSNWRALGMPAFQIEPFLNDYSNYISKLEIQVTGFSIRSRYSQAFYSYLYAETWDKISRLLDESVDFGDAMRQMKYLNAKAKELQASNLSIEDKIKEAHRYIIDNIKWNGLNSLYASIIHRKNFSQNHSGNSADINLALISLLKKIGIKAYPVVLSTLDNGLIKSHVASLRKINYVICFVKHENLELLIDATSEHLIPGILPKRCLNVQGWLVDKDNGRWIELNPNQKKRTKQFVNIKINDEGYFEAEINKSNYQYAYLNWVEEIKKSDNGKSYKAHLLKEFPDLENLKHNITKDKNEQLYSSELMSVDMINQVDDLGDEYIINPYLMTEFSKNLFKSETRKYPVDLNYPIEESSTIVLKIPEGYKAQKVPLNINLKGLNNDLSFVFICKQNHNYVNINYKIEIKRSIFTEAEYHFLRSFFSAISDKFSQPVSLKKI